MDLVARLKDTKIKLSDLVIENVPRTLDKSILRNIVSETLAHEMLISCGATTWRNESAYSDEYLLQRTPVGVDVKVNSDLFHEFDGYYSFNGSSYFIEVKSNALNGFSQKIPRALEIAKSFNSEILLFFPCGVTDKAFTARILEAENPGLYCIDLGYRKKNFESFVSSLYFQNYSNRRDFGKTGKKK